QLGDPEVQQLNAAVFCYQNVARFQIAMDDEILMRVRGSLAHIKKKLQTFGNVEFVFIAVDSDREADDVFHHYVGQASVGRSAIEQPGDVGMLEVGQNLALLPESARRVAAGTGPREFYGDQLLI